MHRSRVPLRSLVTADNSTWAGAASDLLSGVQVSFVLKIVQMPGGDVGVVPLRAGRENSGGPPDILRRQCPPRSLPLYINAGINQG